MSRAIREKYELHSRKKIQVSMSHFFFFWLVTCALLRKLTVNITLHYQYIYRNINYTLQKNHMNVIDNGYHLQTLYTLRKKIKSTCRTFSSFGLSHVLCLGSSLCRLLLMYHMWSVKRHRAIAMTGRAHCQRQVAFFIHYIIIRIIIPEGTFKCLTMGPVLGQKPKWTSAIKIILLRFY